MRIALLYNLKANVECPPDAPVDALAEYDTEETVRGLERALAAGGHTVIPLEADCTLLDTIRQGSPDLCFNIAEGLRGESRESHVPALLEMLGVPYTASGVLANALSLDKAMCKLVWRAHGLPTAPFQLFRTGEEPLDEGLSFPLFVKPAREGTGMGVAQESVVRNERELRERANWIVCTYQQPALAEAFLPGREFTVGLIGNERRVCALPHSPIYDERGFHVFPVLEIDVSPVEEAEGIYSGHIKSERPMDPAYLCPAPIDGDLTKRLQDLAVRAFAAIGAADVGRVDFRLDEECRPYLLEINTLPGLNPKYSDIVMQARGEGMEYEVLVNEIVHLAMARYGLGGMGLRRAS